MDSDWHEAVRLLAAKEKTKTDGVELNLAYKHVGDEGCSFLAQWWPQLWVGNLELIENDIGPQGAKLLTDAFEKYGAESLRDLSLFGNRIGMEGAQSLAKMLQSERAGSHLTSLNLCETDIGQEGALHVADALRFNPSLKYLNLGHCGIRDFGMVNLAVALRSFNTCLTELDLCQNEMEEDGARHFGEMLHFNSTLKKLNLESNAIHVREAVLLAEGLEANQSLQVLSLDGNQIGIEGAKRLAEALVVNRHLTELQLSDNAILFEGAEHFAGIILGGMSLLKILNLCSNSIQVGCIPLADALKSNLNLSSLWLGYTGIDCHGASALADALMKNTTITDLNLGANLIESEGAAALATMLQRNTGLKMLWLFGCRITDVGAAHLARALLLNQTLIHLDIGSNDITFRGTHELVEAIKSNSSLQKLDLSYNLLEDLGAISIARGLELNQGLTSFHVSMNGIAQEGAIHLLAALKENVTLMDLRFNSFEATDAYRAIVEESKALLKRNRDLAQFVRSIALLLIGIRFKVRGDAAGMGDLGRLPKEVVVMIAKKLWATSYDKIWLSAMQSI